MIRPPLNALRPLVKDVWVSEGMRPGRPPFKEYSLPDGCMHVVIRLSGGPIRIADSRYPTGYDYGYGVVGGARTAAYTREIFGPVQSIGATLRPGAAQALFGASALELANRHTNLEEIWGPQVALLRERLLDLGQPHLQLTLFETHLLARLPQVKGIHPALAQALADAYGLADVRTMVLRSGVSHRRFIELFGHAVGVTPKRFVRVRRFQHMLRMLTRNPSASWIALAQDAGYTDQAHFNREFREFSGLTPQQYKRAAPESPAHVVLPDAGAGR
jgi:AraC-like DNA-binding protein